MAVAASRTVRDAAPVVNLPPLVAPDDAVALQESRRFQSPFMEERRPKTAKAAVSEPVLGRTQALKPVLSRPR